VEEWAIMKTLSAKVLDPKHLELAEPLPSTTGEWIRIVIPDADDEIPIVDENEKERIVAAVQLVHDMTSRADRAFGDFRERLAWLSERLSERLPEAITGKPAPAPSQPPTSAAKKEHFERPQEPVKVESWQAVWSSSPQGVSR
jgi:hypothetical protein